MQALYSYYQNQSVNLEEVRRRVHDQLIEIPEFYNAAPEEKAGYKALLPILLDESFAGTNPEIGLEEQHKWLARIAQTAVADWENENARQKKQILEGVKADILQRPGKEVFFWTLFRSLLSKAESEGEKSRKSAKDLSTGEKMKIAAHPFLPLLDFALSPDKKPSLPIFRSVNPEWLIRLYPVLFRNLPEYRAYQNKAESSEEIEQEIWKTLYRKLLRSEIFNEIMEELDLHWSENRILLEVALKENYIRLCNGNSPVFSVDPDENEEMNQFFLTLFESCLQNQAEDEHLISGIISNWDADRISPTDKYIILLSLNEMRKFPHIPVKVTINEYLEIAKSYSSPGSVAFINGITDRMAKLLQKSGELKKSARGLMDNR